MKRDKSWLLCVFIVYVVCEIHYYRVDGAVVEDPKFNVSQIEKFLSEGTLEHVNTTHSNNWAVIVDTSAFWYNYRHVANTFSIYRTVKRLGIPDNQIILMVADDVACNPRNRYIGTVINNRMQRLNVYGSDIEVDYRGYEVSVDNFIRILTGRHHSNVPSSKRLLTDERSNILIYMTGHGGDEFLKFQDFQEICSRDLADAFEQMWEKKRYHQIFFMVDTCQATTLYSHFRSPNIFAVGSSSKGENSYSHHVDSEIGVAMVDRFTYHTLEFFEKVKVSSKKTFGDLFSVFNKNSLRAQPQFRGDLFPKKVNSILVTDFFGAVLNVVESKYLNELEFVENEDGETGEEGWDEEEEVFWETTGEEVNVEQITKEQSQTSTETKDFTSFCVATCSLVALIIFLFSK